MFQIPQGGGDVRNVEQKLYKEEGIRLRKWQYNTKVVSVVYAAIINIQELQSSTTLDPNQKDFGIGSKGYTRSFDKVKKELDKCICVCANCHREIHAGLIDIK